MVENNHKKRGPVSANIKDILKERDRLEQVLQEEFKKEVTILLTDICGYTNYIDTMGDISGRAMLLKHNDLVLPRIEEYRGKVVEMVGDAVMASFSSHRDAVKSAVAIQKTLYRHNKDRDALKKIQVKIGINAGKVLVDNDVLFQGFTGDVANVAARIQAQAGADDIFISKSVYDIVREDEEILVRFNKTIKVKGKSKPLEIYTVVWKEYDPAQKADPADLIPQSVAMRMAKSSAGLLQLEVTRDGNRLKLSANEQIPGEESTIRHYQEISVAMDIVKAKCQEMIDLLNKSRRSENVGKDILTRLKQIGQSLYDELFSIEVKEKLKKTRAEYLSLKIDDQLVHVPWELLYDGREFLSLRFNMGRLVKTRQSVPAGQMRNLARPFKMLILADPAGDLEGAYEEGIQIRDYMDNQGNLINTFLDSGNITVESIKAKIRNFDIVHFAGHADYNLKNSGDSGWQFSGANLKARDITKMIGTASMPALIFSNACQSARTEEWFREAYVSNEVFGLANAFLLAGVRHYVGTFWEISDTISSHFALKFYRHLFSGHTIGEAIRQSRSDLIKEHGEGAIAWASYVLYGDPTFSYQDQIEAPQDRQAPEPDPEPLPRHGRETRTREEIIDFSPDDKAGKRRIWMAMTAAAVVCAAVVLWVWPGLLRESSEIYEQKALSLYHEGNFQEALDACTLLEKKAPQSSLAYLIRGNIFLSNGNLDAAGQAYQQAVSNTKGTNAQKASALVGLGRLASIGKETEKALSFYEKASQISPDSRSAFLSQAVLLEDRGDFKGALDMLSKARAAGPEDPALNLMSREAVKRAELAADREKQEQIDKTIKELLKTMNASPPDTVKDDWTSLPLTLWLMDLDSEGYALEEGSERLILSCLTDQLLQQGRIRLVERSILDKLVQELKLGTSKLSDQRTSLSLGKILAARLIVSGRVIYSGPQTQVSLRVIETETGQICAAVNKTFGSRVPAMVLGKNLSGELYAKIEALFPLRAKILEAGENSVSLNIGRTTGVRTGQQFATLDKSVTLEVVSVLQDKSIAKMIKGGGPLKQGLEVESL